MELSSFLAHPFCANDARLFRGFGFQTSKESSPAQMALAHFEVFLYKCHLLTRSVHMTLDHSEVFLFKLQKISQI